MNNPLLESIIEDWEKLKVALAANSTTLHTADLEKILAKCLAAGESIDNYNERDQLQNIANEVADRLFARTNVFPKSIIRPPNQNTIEQQIQKLNSNWKIYSRLMVVPALLLLALLGYYTHHQIELAREANNQLDQLKQRDETREITIRELQASYDLGKKNLSATSANLEASEKERAVLLSKIELSEQANKYINQALKDTKAILAERDQAIATHSNLRQMLENVFRSMSEAEQKSVSINNCLSVIRSCCVMPEKNNQLKGAIRMLSNPDQDHYWIIPRNANLAALALLASNKHIADPVQKNKDRNTVHQWMLWFANNQNPATKSINEYEGYSLKINIIKDRVDTQAIGTFLILAERYYKDVQLIPDEDKVIIKSAELCLEEILERAAIANTAVKSVNASYQLPTGVIDCGGLIAAAKLFARINDAKKSEAATKAAKLLAKRLRSYFQLSGQSSIFAATVNLENGRYAIPSDKLSAGDAEANLYGLAWIQWKDATPWKVVVKDCRPGDEEFPHLVAPKIPVELWLAAATRIDLDNENPKKWLSDWQFRTRFAAFRFHHKITYLDRAAFTLLTLLEGTSWIYTVEDADMLP